MWQWFNGEGAGAGDGVGTVAFAPPPDYRKMARTKKEALAAIRADPGLLFKVVDSEYDCMCGGRCGNCTYTDVTFFDLTLQHKTITEADLLQLESEGVSIDWYKVSEAAPLSRETLRDTRKKGAVDWKAISMMRYGGWDEDFLREFADVIVWNVVPTYLLRDVVSKTMIFEERIIPLEVGLSGWHWSVDELLKWEAVIVGKGDDEAAGAFKVLIERYSPEVIEAFSDEIGVRKVLEGGRLGVDFYKACRLKQYTPRKYGDVLAGVVDSGLGTWSKFIEQCQPEEAFLNKYVMNSKGCDKETIDMISGCGGIYKVELSEEFIKTWDAKLNWKYLLAKQRFPVEVLVARMCMCAGRAAEDFATAISRQKGLDTEFIDEYAEKLDWYELCEHQELPEWLLRKHLKRLNWGQVSAYQRLSSGFIAEFRDRLNWVKLGKKRVV